MDSFEDVCRHGRRRTAVPWYLLPIPFSCSRRLPRGSSAPCRIAIRGTLRRQAAPAASYRREEVIFLGSFGIMGGRRVAVRWRRCARLDFGSGRAGDDGGAGGHKKPHSRGQSAAANVCLRCARIPCLSYCVWACIVLRSLANTTAHNSSQHVQQTRAQPRVKQLVHC